MNPQPGKPLPFGLVLKQTRIKSGFTQTGLADATGLDRTYISLLERSLRMPCLGVLLKIAKSLNIKASEIVEMVEACLESDPDLVLNIPKSKYRPRWVSDS